MSNWDFEEMGEFGSDADADRWAKRNNIAPQDVRTVSYTHLTLPTICSV